MSDPQTISPFSSGDVHVPNAATAAVVTLNAGGALVANVIAGVAYSYSATPTGGKLTIADGSETVLDLDIPAAGEKVINFIPPRKGRPNRSMTITLASGGGSVQGKLAVLGHWTESNVLAAGMFDFSDDSESGLAPLLF